MATTTEAAERDRLAGIPTSYFSAVDSLDVDAVLEHFAEDATLTVQSARADLLGPRGDRAHVQGLLRRLGLDGSRDHEHRRRARRRQGRDRKHVDLVRDGTTKTHNCNFFDVNPEGKFSRVIIWMDGANPLT